MKTFKFEVKNWNSDDAEELGKESFIAQAAAMEIPITEIELGMYQAMSYNIDQMLNSLQIHESQSVYISANASLGEDGAIVLNFTFSISAPSA